MQIQAASRQNLVQQVSQLLRQKQWCMATAESCTGGLIAAAMTELAGSSDVFDCGFVTYSNQAKELQLGVSDALLVKHGAVSEQVALAMAAGAAARAEVPLTVAVTGVAGPGGGSDEKPVGTVWIAWWCEGESRAQRFLFSGDRQHIREATVKQALYGVIQTLSAR